MFDELREILTTRRLLRTIMRNFWICPTPSPFRFLDLQHFSALLYIVEQYKNYNEVWKIEYIIIPFFTMKNFFIVNNEYLLNV